MKLPTTAALVLFLNSVSATAKITGGDDHMIRNLLAKVEAQDTKISKLEALLHNAKIDELHDAKIAHDAKIDELNTNIAKLETLLGTGCPSCPQGKKNLRHRGLFFSNYFSLPKFTNENENTHEEEANDNDTLEEFVDTLMDFATMTEEKADDMIAQLGVAHVLKDLIFKINPVFNCLSYDKDSQTCTLGSDDTDTVDIIAEEDIDVRAVQGGDVTIDAEEGGKFKH